MPLELQTSASELANEVSQQFLGSGHLRLRTVKIAEDHGSVVLSGQVPSFYLKQLAQSIAVTVPGVGAIQNELTVE
jgi:osmotically-inducible protein OsmY